MTGKDQGGEARKDQDKARMERDGQDWQHIVPTIQAMVNPIEYKGEDLIRLCCTKTLPGTTSSHHTS